MILDKSKVTSQLLVWAEYYPVTVIVNTPVDISDPQQYRTVMNFVEEFEKLPSNKGNFSGGKKIRPNEF